MRTVEMRNEDYKMQKNTVNRYLFHTGQAHENPRTHFMVSYKPDNHMPKCSKIINRDKLFNWFNSTAVPFSAKIHSDVLLIDFLDPTIFGNRFVSIKALG